MVGRLQTLRPRLLQRYQEIAAREQLKQWQTHAQTLASEGEQLAADLALYGEVAPKLVDAFSRLAGYRQKLSALYADRPPGVDDICDPELEARKLRQFSRDCPSLLESVTLRDWHSGKEVWPARSSAQFAATFAQSMAVPLHPGPAWCDPEIQQRQRAEREAERQRDGVYHAEAARAKEVRVNREAAERLRRLTAAGKQSMSWVCQHSCRSRVLVILMLVQKSCDLSSESRSIQKLAHRASIVEQLSLQLCRQGIPLHDQCGAEAPQDELFFVRDRCSD
jgi:hypothetical protein